MPIYAYRCDACGIEFDKMRPMSEATEPQPCPECEGETRKLVTSCGVIFKGDDWTSKNGRVSQQMRKRREHLGRKEKELVRDGGVPGGKLVPNVGGEKTDSWKDAAKLAKSKGKDSTGYERMAQKEKSSR